MAATNRTPASNPPNPPPGYFNVTQRLLRGYGPLAVFAILLLLMAMLVPSKSPQNASSSGDGTLSSSDGGSDAAGGTDGTTDTSSAAGADASGAASGTGQAAGAPAAGGARPGQRGGTAGGAPTSVAKGAPNVAGVRPCPDRKDQVPGDPYSPPCVSFTGDNGGATSTGVNPTEIHVAFRVLNEKGFQQTLAELAGASLSDTPDDIKRTISALSEFFNKRYQFYGRKIVFDFYNGVGSNTTELLGGGRDKAEADAETVKGMKAFADMSATSEPYA